MSPRRQKWTFGAICGALGVASGTVVSTVKIGLGARTMAQDLITETARAVVNPVEKRLSDHELEAKQLRPVMLGWKDDMTRAMQRHDRLLLAICQATPHAKCVEADE